MFIYEKNLARIELTNSWLKKSHDTDCTSEACDSKGYKECTFAKFITKYTASRLLWLYCIKYFWKLNNSIR